MLAAAPAVMVSSTLRSTCTGSSDAEDAAVLSLILMGDLGGLPATDPADL
jgi:hypothetical protein